MSEKPGEKAEFPNQKRLLDQITSWIATGIDDPIRRNFADERMRRTLLASFEIDWKEALPPTPKLDEVEQNRSDVASLYLALARIHHLIDQTQHYFSRYPFHNLPVSKSDHLNNICELYYDRIGRFRDRIKNITKTLKKIKGQEDPRYGRLISWFNDAFEQELRHRNYIQHHGMFDYPISEQLSLIELLGPRLPQHAAGLGNNIYRAEALKWKRKCASVFKALNHVVEIIAGFILEFNLWSDPEPVAANQQA